jgi:hypothetical protein
MNRQFSSIVARSRGISRNAFPSLEDALPDLFPIQDSLEYVLDRAARVSPSM